MPAFTFEKIAPPVRRGSVSGSVSSAPPSGVNTKKPRGMIVQILDRFADTRHKRKLREDKGVSSAGLSRNNHQK